MAVRQLVVAFERLLSSHEHPVLAMERHISEEFVSNGWSGEGRFCSIREVSFIADNHIGYRSALANSVRPAFSPLPAKGFIPSADSLGVAPKSGEVVETAVFPEIRLDFARTGFVGSTTILQIPGALGRSWVRSIMHPNDLLEIQGVTAVLTDFSALLDFGETLAWIDCTDLGRIDSGRGDEMTLLQPILSRIVQLPDLGGG